jgi:hypothetical protein
MLGKAGLVEPEKTFCEAIFVLMFFKFSANELPVAGSLPVLVGVFGKYLWPILAGVLPKALPESA